MKFQHVSVNEIAQIKEYLKTHTYTQTCEKFGRSLATIARIVKDKITPKNFDCHYEQIRAKLPREFKRNAKYSDIEVQEIRDMHKHGYSYKEIAEAFNGNYSTIYYIINPYNRINITKHSNEYCRDLYHSRKHYVNQLIADGKINR